MATPKAERMPDEREVLTVAVHDVDTMPEEILLALGAEPAQEASAPTLDEAFHMLCRAMYPLLEEDMPAQMHSNDIRAMYADGNHLVSWRHAVLLLEKVLGQRISAA